MKAKLIFVVFSVLLFNIDYLAFSQGNDSLSLVRYKDIDKQRISDICVGDDNVKYISAKDGIYIIKNKSEAKLRLQGYCNYIIEKDMNGNILLGTPYNKVINLDNSIRFKFSSDTHRVGINDIAFYETILLVGSSVGIFSEKPRINGLFGCNFNVNSICYSKETKIVWIASNKGLYYLKDDRLKKVKGLAAPKFEYGVRKVIMYNGFLWCATVGGIWRYNEKSEWKNIISKDNYLKENNCVIRDLAFDQSGALWVASDIIAKYDKHGEWFFFDKHTLYAKCIEVDKENVVWIGTDNEGIFYINNPTIQEEKKSRLNIVLLLDNSGSVDQYVKLLKKGIAMWFENLQKNDQVSIFWKKPEMGKKKQKRKCGNGKRNNKENVTNKSIEQEGNKTKVRKSGCEKFVSEQYDFEMESVDRARLKMSPKDLPYSVKRIIRSETKGFEKYMYKMIDSIYHKNTRDKVFDESDDVYNVILWLTDDEYYGKINDDCFDSITKVLDSVVSTSYVNSKIHYNILSFSQCKTYMDAYIYQTGLAKGSFYVIDDENLKDVFAKIFNNIRSFKETEVDKLYVSSAYNRSVDISRRGIFNPQLLGQRSGAHLPESVLVKPSFQSVSLGLRYYNYDYGYLQFQHGIGMDVQLDICNTTFKIDKYSTQLRANDDDENFLLLVDANNIVEKFSYSFIGFSLVYSSKYYLNYSSGFYGYFKITPFTKIKLTPKMQSKGFYTIQGAYDKYGGIKNPLHDIPRYDFFTDSFITYCRSSKKDLKGGAYSIQAGIGFNYRFSKNYMLQIGLNCFYGESGISSNPLYIDYKGRKVRNYSLTSLNNKLVPRYVGLEVCINYRIPDEYNFVSNILDRIRND